MLVLFLLVVATSLGVICLNVLDGPTKFQTQKEASTRE